MEYLSPLGLEVFKTTVELGTFKAASEKLKISQPAVSAHIQRIEKYLGVKLFVNSYSRKLTLSEAGYHLYQYAVEISTKNKEILEAFKQINEGKWGEVRFAVCASRYLMASLVSSYSMHYPNVNVIFLTTSSSRGKELLKHGEVDFAFLMNPDDSQLKSIPLYHEPMKLVCSSDHPLAQKDIITKNDLSNYGFVTCIEGTDYNLLLEHYLYCLGVYQIKKIIQVEDPIMLLKIVEEAGGIGFLSRSTVENSLLQGKIKMLSLQEEIISPTIEIHLFFRHNTKINKASQFFLKYILEETTKKFPYVVFKNKQEIYDLFSRVAKT